MSRSSTATRTDVRSTWRVQPAGPVPDPSHLRIPRWAHRTRVGVVRHHRRPTAARAATPRLDPRGEPHQDVRVVVDDRLPTLRADLIREGIEDVAFGGEAPALAGRRGAVELRAERPRDAVLGNEAAGQRAEAGL